MRPELQVPFCARCTNPCPTDGVPAPEFDPPRLCRRCAGERAGLEWFGVRPSFLAYSVAWPTALFWIFGIGFRSQGCCGSSPLTGADLVTALFVAWALTALWMIRSPGPSAFIRPFFIHATAVYSACAIALLFSAYKQVTLIVSDTHAGHAVLSVLLASAAALGFLALGSNSRTRLSFWRRPTPDSRRDGVWSRLLWLAVAMAFAIPGLHDLGMVAWRCHLRTNRVWDGDPWAATQIWFWTILSGLVLLAWGVSARVRVRDDPPPLAGRRAVMIAQPGSESPWLRGGVRPR